MRCSRAAMAYGCGAFAKLDPRNVGEREYWIAVWSTSALRAPPGRRYRNLATRQLTAECCWPASKVSWLKIKPHICQCNSHRLRPFRPELGIALCRCSSWNDDIAPKVWKGLTAILWIDKVKNASIRWCHSLKRIQPAGFSVVYIP